tara:strand:- start:3838 stop:4116 length:279 start_codon:yes stop_codon:yes gene_type:complete
MNEKDRDEFIIMKSDIQHTKEGIKSIQDNVKEISLNMSRITLSMFNDDLTGSEGIIQMTKRNGVRLTKLENIKVAVIALFTAVVSGVTWMLK